MSRIMEAIDKLELLLVKDPPAGVDYRQLVEIGRAVTRLTEAVKADLPRPGPDSLGRQYRSVVHDAIDRGDWDAGSLVKEKLAAVLASADPNEPEVALHG